MSLLQILGTKSISFYSPDHPDTFVECYIKDNNEKVRQRKKTETVRNNLCPTFNNIVKYAVCLHAYYFFWNYI